MSSSSQENYELSQEEYGDAVEKLYLEAKRVVDTYGWDDSKLEPIVQCLMDLKITMGDIQPLETKIFGVKNPNFWMHSYGNPPHEGRGLLAFDITKVNNTQLSSKGRKMKEYVTVLHRSLY